MFADLFGIVNFAGNIDITSIGCDNMIDYWALAEGRQKRIKGIKGVDYKFNYPDEALDTIKTLNEECLTFLLESDNCEGDCSESLTRMPILKVKNIRYQILKFYREAEV